VNILAFPGPKRRASRFPREAKVGDLRLGAEFALIGRNGLRGSEGTVVEEARGYGHPLVVLEPDGRERRMSARTVVLALGTVSPNYQLRRAS
jgi:hypothetical protein